MPTRLFVLLLGLGLGVAVSAASARAQKAGPAKPKPKREGVLIERVVAVINDKIVLESEVAERARPLLGDLQKESDPRERERQLQKIVRQVLSDMVDEELVLEAARAAKLEVTDAEVERAITEVRKQNKLSEEQFAEALKMQGSSPDKYRKEVRVQLLRLRAVNMMVGPRVQVTDKQVKEQYDRLLGEASATAEVNVRHILIRLPENPDAQDITDAQRRAGELVVRARAGENFVTLAKNNSEDLQTKEDGGALGWFKRGELPSEWEDILFAMSENEVRGPVRGPTGFHVFQVTKTKTHGSRPFKEAQAQIRRQLELEAREKYTHTWLEELRKKAHVEIKL